jgi:hypothetical protein
MFLEKFKWFILSVATILICTSCTNSKESLVQKHLELIKSNKLEEANLQYCFTEEKLSLQNLKDFKIISSEEKLSPANSKTPLYYTNFVVDIIGSTPNTFTARAVKVLGVDQVSIQVWKSDAFFDSLKGDETLRRLRKLPVRERDEINKNESCLFLQPDQVESDSSLKPRIKIRID